MRPFARSSALSAAALLLPSAATAYVQLPFTRQPLPAFRDIAVNPNEVKPGSLLVNVTVGTPAQALTAAVNLGISESWIPDARYKYCPSDASSSSSSSHSCPGISFDTFESTTFGHDSTYWSAKDSASVYFATGEVATDSFGIGEFAVDDVTFGLVRDTNHWTAMLGLGFNDSRADAYGYPTVLGQMVDSGIITSPAMSIWLDNPDEAMGPGQLLLGAVDTARYEAPLVRLAAPLSDSYFNEFGVLLASFNGSTEASGNLQPYADTLGEVWVSIDPAEPLSNLPIQLASRIWDMANATTIQDYGAIVPCSARDTLTGRVAFSLGGLDGPVIEAPLKDLVLAFDPLASSTLKSETGAEPTEEMCLFGVQARALTRNHIRNRRYERTDEYYNIGSSLLKRTYVVLDQANAEVSFAKLRPAAADLTAADSTIVNFESYGAAPPESTLATPIVCTSWTTSGVCDNWDTIRDNSSYEYSSRRGIPATLAIILIVLAVFMLISIVVGIVWFCCRRRQKRAIAKRDAAGAETLAQAAPVPQMMAMPMAPPPMAMMNGAAPMWYAPPMGMYPQGRAMGPMGPMGPMPMGPAPPGAAQPPFAQPPLVSIPEGPTAAASPNPTNNIARPVSPATTHAESDPAPEGKGKNVEDAGQGERSTDQR